MADCIKLIQNAIGLSIPTTTSEWMDTIRNEIDIRYGMVVEDSLRAVKKTYFNPKRLIKVHIYI